MSRFYVQTRDLPQSVQHVLRGLGYGKPDICVDLAETYRVASPAMQDGTRGVSAMVNLATGESHAVHGSWGGPTPFAASNHADMDNTPRPLPVGAVHVRGSTGNKVWLHLVVHPETVNHLALPAPKAAIDLQHQQALQVIDRYKAGYRADEFRRQGLGPYRADNLLIAELAKLGMVKINKAGAIAITTDGRNAIANTRNVLA